MLISFNLIYISPSKAKAKCDIRTLDVLISSASPVRYKYFYNVKLLLLLSGDSKKVSTIYIGLILDFNKIFKIDHFMYISREKLKSGYLSFTHLVKI